MNAKNAKPAPAPILSRSLTAYKLSKRHQNILQRFEDMRRYMALAGKEPTVVRLSIADFADINTAIRNQSNGRRELSDLNYNGLPILSVEKSPQMELTA